MESKSFLPQVVINSTEVLTQFNSGQLLVIDGDRQGGIIICKRHHAEFAGPGAAIGGIFDIECCRVIPIGDLNLVYPETYEHRQQAYAIRQQWIRLTQEVTNNPVPLERGVEILTLLEEHFDHESVSYIPDECLAMLVGVLPKTIKMSRKAIPNKLEKSKISTLYKETVEKK